MAEERQKPLSREDLERARRTLRAAHQSAVGRLVAFVVENEGDVLACSANDFDATGTLERLQGLQHELFILGYLLGSLPQPAEPAKPALADPENEKPPTPPSSGR